MKQVLIRGAAALLLLAMVPAVALAQASITGIVRDTSGAVLPGVTVEATSPVIIEKVRSATTDGTGRFIIPDLRPGTYRVTFSLPGFRSVVRDELELQGTSVVTANADMAVGAVEETITVSGATPTVDLQSTTRQVSITQEIVSQIPSSRNPFALGVLIAGVTQSFGGRDVGGAVVAEVAALSANGGRTNDQRMMVNGVALSSGIGGGWGGGAVPNAAGTQEFAIDVSAVDAQAATGGVRVNFIPRDGGNQFSGTIFGSYSRGSCGVRQLHRHRRSAARADGAEQDQGERRLQSWRWRTDRARQVLVLRLGSCAEGGQSRRRTVHERQRERPDADPLRQHGRAGHPAPGSDDLPAPPDLSAEQQEQDWA